MLQQTRVAAALPFYERFLERFPNVAALAKAPEQELLAVWAGLGYYSRARNMQRAAKAIVASGFPFPRTYDDLFELTGIGGYTAAAIASIAYDLPYAAVDGNLLRVLARLDNDPSDIASAKTRERFEVRANELLDRKHPGEFNQAMMELGATVCVPRGPHCGECPVREFCVGFQAGRVSELPVKLRAVRKEIIEITLLLIERKGRILMRQRAADASQMAGFWEIPEYGALKNVAEGEVCGEFRHAITFRQFRYTVHKAVLRGRAPAGYEWVEVAALKKIPVTTAAKKALLCLYL